MVKKINILINIIIVAIIGVALYMFVFDKNTSSNSNGGSNPSSDNSIAIENIVIDSADVNLYINETRKLYAVIIPNNATNQTLVWNSSDSSVATIDDSGIIKAVGVGEANVTVSTSDNSIVKVCHVKVLTKEIKEIRLSRTSITLKVGGSSTLSATVVPADATNSKILFQSSDANIATVDANGKIDAKASGKVVITVTNESKTVEAKCEVIVEETKKVEPPPTKVLVDDIKLDKELVVLTVNAKEKLNAIITPTNNSEKITWVSSNSDIASIDENGVVTAKKVGNVTVAARTSDSKKIAKCRIRIAQVVTFNQQNKGVEEYLKNPKNVESIYNTHCGNIKCDKPINYSINTADNINVYLYNETTHVKTLVGTTTKDNLNYYMLPYNTYYLELASNSNAYKLVKLTGQVRMISDTIQNLRDLGGWKADGGTIKYGRIYRSATTDKLSENTIKALNLSKIIDLREDDELESPTEASKKIREMNSVDSYDVSGTRVRNAVLKIMQAVVDNKNVIFNCHWGKDRTGTVAYVLEGILGADLESRLEDYDLTWFFYQRSNRYIFHVDDLIHQFDEFKKTTYEQEQFIYWFLKYSSNKNSDLELINRFRKAMINGTPHEYKLSGDNIVLK